MNWIQTVSGKRFDFLEPDPEAISLFDIAWSLFAQPRFNGHLDSWWTIGQHSLAVARLVEQHVGQTCPTAVLQALLHDAAEAYVGDMISPLKQLIPDFEYIELRVLKMVFVKFGLPLTMPLLSPIVKEADAILCSTEAEYLFKQPCVGGWNKRPAPPLETSALLDDIFPLGYTDYVSEVRKWQELSKQQLSTNPSSVVKILAQCIMGSTAASR